MRSSVRGLTTTVNSRIHLVLVSLALILTSGGVYAQGEHSLLERAVIIKRAFDAGVSAGSESEHSLLELRKQFVEAINSLDELIFGMTDLDPRAAILDHRNSLIVGAIFTEAVPLHTKRRVSLLFFDVGRDLLAHSYELLAGDVRRQVLISDLLDSTKLINFLNDRSKRESDLTLRYRSEEILRALMDIEQKTSSLLSDFPATAQTLAALHHGLVQRFRSLDSR
jgi:hypothetical protein